jgi:hypothetical protein
VNEEERIVDGDFLVCLTILLCNLRKEFLVKVKLITEAYHNKKKRHTLRFNLLKKPITSSSYPHPKSLDATYSERA